MKIYRSEDIVQSGSTTEQEIIKEILGSDEVDLGNIDPEVKWVCHVAEVTVGEQTGVLIFVPGVILSDLNVEER